MVTIPFLPTNAGPFQFQCSLDGQQYIAQVGWNFVGRRYFISLFDLSGNRIFTLPLIGSTDGVAIQTIEWNHGIVTVTTLGNHGYLVGFTMDLVISGCIPVEYNGTVSAFITGRNTFQYALAGDPGDASQLGLSNYNINIAAGYFTESTLVFRESNQTFEVTP